MKYRDLLVHKDLPHRVVLSIDMKSFYASVECVSRGLDPLTVPLVVADKERGPGSLILAATPYLKSLGVKSPCRIRDLPTDIDIIFAKPRMQLYLDTSIRATEIFLDFVPEDDLHVYSIDESFLDITHNVQAKKVGAIAYAKKIMKRIKDDLGLYVTVGIGENIFMAKAAMDIEAKKSPNFIARWTYDSIPTKLWPVTPLSKMWGIGRRLEKRLNDLGFFCIGDIATSSKDFLKDKFGLIGEEIYNHSHGIDYALINEIYVPKSKSLSVGQVLFKDYSKKDSVTLVLEMAEELIYRARREEKLIGHIQIMAAFTYSEGGGFQAGMKFGSPTEDEDEIKAQFKRLFLENCPEDAKIRKLGLYCGEFAPLSSLQLDLFTSLEEIEKKRRLNHAIDSIREKYGFDKITKATATTEESTFYKRTKQIGGHSK